jgi:hypothetical protein
MSQNHSTATKREPLPHTYIRGRVQDPPGRVVFNSAVEARDPIWRAPPPSPSPAAADVRPRRWSGRDHRGRQASSVHIKMSPRASLLHTHLCFPRA